MLRLYLFWALYGSLITGGAAAVFFGGKRLLRGPLERHHRRVVGIRNAHLLDAKEGEICFVCLEQVNAEADAYDPKKGWYHAKCFKQLLVG